MDIKMVKQLADLMDERGLVSVEVCSGDEKIKLSREVRQATAPMMAPVAAAPVVANVPVAPSAQPASENEQPGEALTAPLVGVAYLSPSPGAEPFVQAGDKVKKGQTLCIIEAMKVMNEFTAPRAGVVLEVCVENGQLVEFGQPLLRLE